MLYLSYRGCSGGSDGKIGRKHRFAYHLYGHCQYLHDGHHSVPLSYGGERGRRVVLYDEHDGAAQCHVGTCGTIAAGVAQPQVSAPLGRMGQAFQGSGLLHVVRQS